MTASLLSEVDVERAETLARQIGRTLRRERENRRETNKQAASALQVDSHTLTSLERGDRPSVSLPVVVKALRRYGYALRVVRLDAGDRVTPSVLERIRAAARTITDEMQQL